LASASGHLECVKFLISIGVNVNPKDRWGATPLNDAKNEDVRDYLIQEGGVVGSNITYKTIKNANGSED
jgi:ankyrin repeat protein